MDIQNGRWMPPKDTLRPGMKDNQVAWLQTTLNSFFGADLEQDASYGPKTTEAVKVFQKKYGLVVDGIFGPKSRAKMLEAMNW